MPTNKVTTHGINSQLLACTGLGVVKKFFRDNKILKFQDIFQDTEPYKHAEKVPLKSSKNTVVTRNQ